MHLKVRAAPEIWTIKPALGTQIIMACIGAPFLALSIGVAAESIVQREITLITVGSVIFLAALGAWCICEVGTARIELTRTSLRLRRFWHTRWTVARDQAEVCAADVGDLRLLPGFTVFNRTTGEKVGEILSSQFRSEDLENLATLLPPRR